MFDASRFRVENLRDHNPDPRPETDGNRLCEEVFNVFWSLGLACA
jgi:hypothetical protein